MLFGHSACGAVDAAIKGAAGKVTLPGHLPALIGQITPTVKIAAKRGGNTLDNAIEENVRLGVGNPAVGGGRPRISGGAPHGRATGSR